MVEPHRQPLEPPETGLHLEGVELVGVETFEQVAQEVANLHGKAVAICRRDPEAASKQVVRYVNRHNSLQSSKRPPKHISAWEAPSPNRIRRRQSTVEILSISSGLRAANPVAMCPACLEKLLTMLGTRALILRS